MKTLLSVLMIVSGSAFAGSPGHTMKFCESESGKTKVTIVEYTTLGEPQYSIAFAITGKSLYYSSATAQCGDQYCDEISKLESHAEEATIYTVGSQSDSLLDIAFEEGGDVKIKSGFYHPRTLKNAGYSITLTCSDAEEQI